MFNCSIETLTGKLGQVVTEKYKIEYGDESKLLAHVDSSENQNSRAKVKTI